MARRKRGTVANTTTSPGEAAAAAGAPPQSVQAAPATPIQSPSAVPATPPGAPSPGQLANAFSGLTQTTVNPTPAAGQNPFGGLGGPATVGQIEVAQGPAKTSAGATESAIQKVHSANPVIPTAPAPDVNAQGIVQLMGDMKSLGDSFNVLGKKLDDTNKSVSQQLTALTTKVDALEKGFASNLAVVLNEIRELAKAAAQPTPPPQPAAPQPVAHQPAPVVPAVSAAPTPIAPGQVPGQAQVPARAQQIAQAISVMLQNHLNEGHQVRVSIHEPQHQLALVQAAMMGDVPFNSAGDPGLDPGCRQEVINALQACGKVGPDGIVVP